MLVAVTSRHRGEAFRACEFLIDYLKTRAPFWKKEVTGEGRALGRGPRHRTTQRQRSWAPRERARAD